MLTSITRIFSPIHPREFKRAVNRRDAKRQKGFRKGCERSRGFTLIELLIVVAILGILTALIAPTLGGERRISLHTEADRLVRLIEMARIQAVGESRQVGLRVKAHGYAFEHYDAERKLWSGQQAGNLYELPQDFDLVLNVESRKVALPRSGKSPQVLILSSGEITPFSVEIFSPSAGSSCLVSCDGIARTKFSCA